MLHLTTMEACSTEDSIRALLEQLVDPLLPLKPNDVPSMSLRESVAKQVHAVVLLYNYYHIRDNPHLECLSFESFCSLATGIRPALLQHFKESEGDGDSELLKKVIVEACSLSMSLDASSDLLVLNRFPIKKVAVLLVDSDKMNCYLQHSYITQGVWSLLEKPIEKATDNQKKEVVFQKVAFAAIKEATGVDHKDIVILERHLVCSLSEEKTAVRFYIMKCNSKDRFSPKIPIEEMINSMQGPLFEKIFSEWATNDKVGYFHVLPYASLIEDWFSRRGDTESVIEKESEAVCDDIERNRKEDASKESEGFDVFGRREKVASKKSYVIKGKKIASLPKRKATARIQDRYLKGSKSLVKEPKVVIKETVLGLKSKNGDNEISPCNDNHLNGRKGGFEIVSDPKDHRERGVQRKKAVPEGLDSILKLNATPSTAHNSNIDFEELHTSISETALNVLLSKRDKLTAQQRYIEDEIVKCDKLIHNTKGDLAMQIKTIVEYCNETCLKDSPSQISKKLKLSETLSPTKKSR